MTRLQPALKRLFTFAASATSQEPFQPDVLVQIGPFDRIAVAEQDLVVALALGAELQARIPVKRHAERTAITQVNR